MPRIRPSDERRSNATHAADVATQQENLGPVDVDIGSVTRAFGSAARFGDAFHLLMQRNGYAQALAPQVAKSVADELGVDGATDLAAQLLEQLYMGAQRHEALFAELAAAAQRGDLFHEVRVATSIGTDYGIRPTDPRGYIEGQIDLLWRDEAGAWHILDYKSGAASETTEAGKHQPQVRLYADATAALLPTGQHVADYGLWFVRRGVVTRWGYDAAGST
jgi:ATP-dependent exoDNAse (exonuclease V) beta subunit